MSFYENVPVLLREEPLCSPPMRPSHAGRVPAFFTGPNAPRAWRKGGGGFGAAAASRESGRQTNSRLQFAKWEYFRFSNYVNLT